MLCEPVKDSLPSVDSLPPALAPLLGVDRDRETLRAVDLYEEEVFAERSTLATRSCDCFSSLASLAGERPPLIFNERERVCERREIATSPACKKTWHVKMASGVRI
jgi:hypothetical protein